MIQARLREEFEVDPINRPVPTDYRTETNRNEVSCSVCSKPLFVDDETLSDVQHSLENGLKNPIVCIDCERDEFDELAYR